MLCLTRKVSQFLRITLPSGETMDVVVNRIGPNSVRLAVDCPREWSIVRSELIEVPTRE